MQLPLANIQRVSARMKKMKQLEQKQWWHFNPQRDLSMQWCPVAATKCFLNAYLAICHAAFGGSKVYIFLTMSSEFVVRSHFNGYKQKNWKQKHCTEIAQTIHIMISLAPFSAYLMNNQPTVLIHFLCYTFCIRQNLDLLQILCKFRMIW